VVSVKSAKCVDTSTGQADDAVVREMLAQGMRTDGRQHDIRRAAAFLRAVGRRRHQSQLRRVAATRHRTRPELPGRDALVAEGSAVHLRRADGRHHQRAESRGRGLYKDLQSVAPGGTWRERFWIKASGF
jgi:hypothetical protein